MHKKIEPNSITFLVLSVIHFKDRPLSYSKNRSQFSPQERAIQTLSTIKSIRQFAPQAKVFLIECGTTSDIPKELTDSVDYYIYVGDNLLVRLCCDSKNKSLGEIVSLIYSLKKVREKLTVNYIFKISGRYRLNKNFTIQNWLRRGFTFKKYTDNVSTRLYGISDNFLDNWRKKLIYLVPSVLLGNSIENALFDSRDQTYNFLSEIGVEGFVGPDASFIKE